MNKISAMQSFVQVAEQASFSAAARVLGRSKASVSKQVSELEASLGRQLLLRTTRHVRLTDAGQTYHTRCRQLLADLEDMESQAQISEASLTGSLRVAGPTTFSELYLAPAMREFMHRHPALQVELVLTDEFVDLLQHQYDLAIRISLLEDSTLIAKRLATSSIVCCASPTYLAEHGTPQDPQALGLHEIIVDTNIRNPTNWRFVVGGIVHAQRVQGRLQVNSTVLVRNLVLAGAGIALIPEFAVLDALSDGRLVRLPLECEIQDLGIYAVYPQRRHLSNRVRVFVDFLFGWFADGLTCAG